VPTVSVPRTVLDARFASGALAGWPNAATGVAWFTPDGYHLHSRTPGRFVAIQAPNSAGTANVSVTMRYRKVSGPPGGGVGVILRDQDPAGRDGLDQGGRFYVLEVSDRGEVGIWRREVDTWIDLVVWTRSDAVQPATAGNVIEARANRDRLTLLVNGREAATATDAVLTSGGVGVFLGGDDNEAALEQLTVQSLD
jgi:hypothetical protein